jgi:predicted acetyltransferase
MTELNFFIETPRLYLSYFQPDIPSHCDWLVELYSTPEFIASNGGNLTSMTSLEAAYNQLLTTFREEHARNRYGRYLVSMKPSTASDAEDHAGRGAAERESADKPSHGEFVGMVTLLRGTGTNAYSVPELGFVIHPSKMRHGYEKEAASALLDYVAHTLCVRDVIGLCDPNNKASQGVFKSLGFRDRGVQELKAFGGKKGVVWTIPGM